MSHYHSNVRDILFNLLEASDLPEHLGGTEFAEFDEDSVRDIVAEMDRLSREDFAASFVEEFLKACGNRHFGVLNTSFAKVVCDTLEGVRSGD